MSSRIRKGPVSGLVPRLKKEGYDLERVTRRRNWVERQTGSLLAQVGTFSVDPETLRGNIENPIGVAQIPLGVAGPLQVNGRDARGLFYVPLATTEGALVRSYERGMVALTRAGGVETAVVQDENQISPSFFFETLSQAAEFPSWVRSHFEELRLQAESTTRHGRLVSARCHPIGLQVILNLGFTTGDAQGMNMIVKAADRVCRWIGQALPDVQYHLFSGMCSEKRPSGYLLNRGKGKWVSASALLPDSILRPYLNCSAGQLYRVWHATLLGHLAAHSVGYNGMLANGLAAMFIALGQDVANIVNSSCGITDFEQVDGGLRVSLTLPALSVATIGGGTALSTQRECLEMLDCYGTGKACKLAEIITAALLGGEISMGAAIASGEFAIAHERYGRNRPPGDVGRP